MRHVIVVAALGLWVGPVAAKELRLDPPTLSARQERCEPRQRDLCNNVAGQKAIESDLSCTACANEGAAMPAEIMSPSLGDTPRPASKVKPRRGPDCEPRSNDPNDACAPLPPLDTLPRP